MQNGSRLRLEDFARVVERLREGLSMAPDPIVRDSVILRFELAFEGDSPPFGRAQPRWG